MLSSENSMDLYHPDRDNLFRFVLGSSSPEETQRIERHLEKCRDCREVVEEIGACLNPSPLDLWLLPRYDESFENAADAALDCAGIAARLSPLRYGSVVVEDARAVAWGYFANSCRVCSDFWGAEQALLTAWRHHVLSGEDPYTEGELLSFTASLRTSQGRFDEAAQALDKAIAIYREGGDDQLEARVLIQKGSALGYGGDFSGAVRLLRKGLSLLDPFEEPQLTLAGDQNFLWFLNEGGMHQEALQVLQDKIIF